MKPKTLVLMGVAIACGLGASYMTSRLLAERQSDDEPKVSVLVAKKNLNVGDTIKQPDEQFQEKKFVRGDEPPGAIDSAEILKNRVLKRPLRAGDHITQDDLIGDKDTYGMPFVLTEGYRAIGVRVNAESVASGFASLPLSRVDIINTVRRGDDKSTYSQVILENVLVLAADTEMRRDESGKPQPAQVVTLALKPEEALKVALAREMGTLSLMLRKINDAHRTENTKLTFEKLKSGEGATGEDVSEVVTSTPPPVVTPPKVEPVTPVVPDPVDPVTEKPSLTKHVLTVVEGSQSRQVIFWLNEAGQVVDSETPDAVPHPPRPTQGSSEEKKK
jgi:pilus assembly protein CpaB